MSKIITDQKKIEALLNRGVNEVINREHLRKQLLSGEKLRIKLGIDPTSSNIHIGRAVLLLKLREFQDLGHTAVFIVGDETGRIGDTSDKESERPMLSEEQVKENMKNYLEQAYTILDPEKTETHYNSEWLKDLHFLEIGKMANAFSVADFNARENIKKRLDGGKRVSLQETLYPIMQGYDSVAVKADVELGGTDQRFNLLAGRHIQSLYGQASQDILMTNLILGLDGRKMSSSWGNTINISDNPNDMFGKAMSLADDHIITYLEHCTRIPEAEIKECATKLQNGDNPRDAKIFLAKSLVALYHGEEEAEKAVNYFIQTFSKGEIPENVPEVKVNVGEQFIDLLTRENLAESKSAARRKMEQGGVSIEGEKITDPQAMVENAHDQKILKVGKKDFVRLRLS